MKPEKTIRKPNQARSIETKGKIISAANELFAELGYYKTTTKLIAKRAGVPVGSVYAYFTDKKGVLLESIRIGHEKIKENMTNVETEERFTDSTKVDIKEFIRSIIESNIEVHRLLPVFHRDMKSLKQTEPDIRKQLEESEKKSYEQTKSILKAKSDIISTEDIEAASIIVHRIIEDLTHFLTYEDTEIEKERIIDEAVIMLSSYLNSEAKHF
ncbi:MAG: TetR/AcrR family transcriptional regulator [Spirochaetales bacterium]|uniref:TetR/AcrR family transcriptional regulator n=1 Tax=Candidatus Thalassospirochaeta sargassi TaxID=3119039 RepID=A0AAJ1IIA3_9SPIO|nr:TetR/AcrR family transcriptional regulator [Spirochaetales bacterium]